jgi:hypothetical protein
VPAAARFTSESTARLRLACATAAATAPPGAIRKHVRSGCAGPHWHARACEGSVGQLACRGFGDSTAATWRRCCLARVSASATPTAGLHCHFSPAPLALAPLAPPLGLAPTHTPALLHSHRPAQPAQPKQPQHLTRVHFAICTRCTRSALAPCRNCVSFHVGSSHPLRRAIPTPTISALLGVAWPGRRRTPPLKTHRRFLECRYSSVGCRALHAVA